MSPCFLCYDGTQNVARSLSKGMRAVVTGQSDPIRFGRYARGSSTSMLSGVTYLGSPPTRGDNEAHALRRGEHVGSRRHGVPRQIAPPLALLAGHCAPDQCRWRARARGRSREPANGIGISAIRGGPRVRRGCVRHHAGARSRPPLECRVGDRARVARRGESELRLRAPDQRERLRRCGPDGAGAVALHARLRPHARPVQTRPGTGIVHPAAGRRRAGRHGDPRPVRSTVTGRCLQQPQHGDARP